MNITRISEGFGATVQNIASAAKNLSVKNSQSPNNIVNFTFLGSAVAGTADSTTLTVSTVNAFAISPPPQICSAGFAKKFRVLAMPRLSVNSFGNPWAQSFLH